MPPSQSELLFHKNRASGWLPKKVSLRKPLWKSWKKLFICSTDNHDGDNIILTRRRWKSWKERGSRYSSSTPGSSQLTAGLVYLLFGRKWCFSHWTSYVIMSLSFLSSKIYNLLWTKKNILWWLSPFEKKVAHIFFTFWLDISIFPPQKDILDFFIWKSYFRFSTLEKVFQIFSPWKRYFRLAGTRASDWRSSIQRNCCLETRK